MRTPCGNLEISVENQELQFYNLYVIPPPIPLSIFYY